MLVYAMILCFPNVDTLIHAIRTETIPRSVILQPVRSKQVDNEILVESLSYDQLPHRSSKSVSLKSISQLLFTLKTGPVEEMRDYAHWFELVPLQPKKTEFNPNETILFEGSSPQEMIALLGELRRLNRSPIGFRWLGLEIHDGFLVQTKNPPAVTLHRATDRNSNLIAYTERKPSIWIEVGYDFPLLDLIPTKPQQLTRIDSIYGWRTFGRADYHPVHSRQAILLSAPIPVLKDHAYSGSLGVRLRFSRLTQSESSTLWLLTTDTESKLREFVHQSPDHIINDLDFAIGTTNQGKCILLRARPSKKGPMELVLDAIPFTPLMRLPNVYLPWGMKINPPLRRDMIRQWFENPDRLTWLFPRNSIEFDLQSIPMDAFRPLTEWVEYHCEEAPVLVQDVKPPLTEFSFEKYQVRALTEEEMPPLSVRKRSKDRKDTEVDPAQVPQITVRKGTAPTFPEVPPEELPEAPELPPVTINEATLRLIELQKQFLELDAPLDSSNRIEIWLAISDCYRFLGIAHDAILCCLNAIWQFPDLPIRLLRRWQSYEASSISSPDRLDRILNDADPQVVDLRQILILLILKSREPDVPGWLTQRIGRISRILEKFETQLPMKAVWLTWRAITKLSGEDVLALTRTRDRLFDSLLETGLIRDRDVPAFLHSATGSGAVTKIDADHLLTFRKMVLRWLETNPVAGSGVPVEQPVSQHCVDWVFSFALARIGAESKAQELIQAAPVKLQKPPSSTKGKPPTPPKKKGKQKAPPPPPEEPTPFEPQAKDYIAWLGLAYRERVEQQLKNLPTGTPLPSFFAEELANLKEKDRQQAFEHGSDRTRSGEIVDRFRQFSRILEPYERTDPYRGRQTTQQDKLAAELASLDSQTDSKQVADYLRLLIRSNTQTRARFQILQRAIPKAFHLGDAFALELLDLIGPTLDKMPTFLDVLDLIASVRLLETAISVAAHYDRTPIVLKLIDRLHQLLDPLEGERAAWLIGSLSGQIFRFWSRLGLRTQAQAFHQRMVKMITQTQPVDKVITRPGLNRTVYLPAFLRLASGWFYFNDEDSGRSAINIVREAIYRDSMSYESYMNLACDYATTLSNAPYHIAVPRIEEIFERFRLRGVTSMRNTIGMVRLVESCVLAMVSDEFAVDQSLRQYMDEDEFLVRKRIHQDVREALKRAGL
jgi:cellulose synthase operon protein C